MPTPKPNLVRDIGRWSLVTVMVNFTIGAGSFVLPSPAAGILGRQSPVAYLIAAARIGVIGACVAEVASRFRQAGGPYQTEGIRKGQLSARFLGRRFGSTGDRR